MFSIAYQSKKCCSWYSIVSDILSLISLCVLLGFDIYFIVNINTCLLTSTCTSRASITSFQFMNSLPAFSSYSTDQSKRLFLYIQVSCGGCCILIVLVHTIVSCISISKSGYVYYTVWILEKIMFSDFAVEMGKSSHSQWNQMMTISYLPYQ